MDDPPSLVEQLFDVERDPLARVPEHDDQLFFHFGPLYLVHVDLTGFEPVSICVPRAAFTDVDTFQALVRPARRRAPWISWP